MSRKTTDRAAPTAADTVKVILDPKARPGLRACGAYKPGRVYEVTRQQSDHLIKAKGFRLATAEDACCTPANAPAAQRQSRRRQRRQPTATG